jgi:large subunit ribosomal protein L10
LKDKEIGSLVAGVLENHLIGTADVKRVADLPSKEQLLGMLVRTLNATPTGFVNVLAGNLRGLVNVLGAVKEKKTA